MATFLLSFVLIVVAIAGLAVGVLLGRAPLRGSCGGLACRGLSCDGCPRRRTER